MFQPSNLCTSIDVGNNVTNLIASNATIRFNVRFNDKFKSSEIIEILDDRLKKTCCNYNMKIKVSGESFFNYRKTHNIIGFAIKSNKKKPRIKHVRGTSDARFISKICPVIEFGIVGKTMHQIDENVNLIDIENLSNIYYQFIFNFFHKNLIFNFFKYNPMLVL